MQTDENMTLVLRELARELDDLRPIIARLAGIPEADKEYIDSTELARRLGVHDQTVDRLVQRGMPHYTFGKRHKFLWNEVKGYLAVHYKDSGALKQWAGAKHKARVA